MRLRDAIDLLILAAVWGASFLFMRIAGPEFGPVVLIQLRVAIAALFLLPIFMVRGQVGELRIHWKKLGLIGTINSAIPFCLLAYAMLSLTGGFAAILNATAPLFGALIAWLWLADKLDGGRIAGLLVGFAGVIVLVWNKVSLDAGGVSIAVLAVILASALYGLGANYTKRHASDVSPLAIATGSQIGATIVLLPATVFLWPAGPISASAWISVALMGIVSTAIAYVLYFRLIANVGPARAIAVTYLVPAFAMIWGAMFINERVTTTMIFGCAIILIGTALATGALSLTGKSGPRRPNSTRTE